MESDRLYLSDSRRLKEFSRYFQTKAVIYSDIFIEHASTGELEFTSGLDSEASYTSELLASTPPRAEQIDYTIAALTKCVVNTLNVEKVMVSLLDDKNQYFIGGACQLSNGVGGSDWAEAMWDGSRIRKLDGRACESVVCMRLKDPNDRPFLVVPDLTEDSRGGRMGDGPYRFYAGTPLRTALGHNIGALFAVDTATRPGLTDCERTVMGRMADQIMSYLSAELKALERNRLMEMNRCLAAFGGAVSTPQHHEEPYCVPSMKYQPKKPSNNYLFGPDRRLSVVEEPEIPSSVVDLVYYEADEQPVTATARAGTPGSEGSKLSTSIYHRAAQHLRVGMSFSGVAYLTTDSNNKGPLACVLGCPVSPEHQPVFSSLILQDLIRIYPQGHIFYFDTEGKSVQSAIEHHHQQNRPFGWSSSVENNEVELEVLLHKTLPRARQIIMVPMWNLKNDTSSVAAIAWRDCWGRLYTDEVDLPFVYSFCMTVIAEVLHEEALVANKQKADFIGSISHELRTPLHGILASNELLKDTPCDTLQEGLVDNVHSSAKVLLDVIDHILDFSVLTADGADSKNPPRSLDGQPEEAPVIPLKPQRGLRTVGQQTPGDLALLCEEVVMAVLLGRNYIHLPSNQHGHDSKLSEPFPRPNVSLHMDWQDWRYSYQSGAVRRIVMNLVGNAMKYTERGFIHVRLELDKSLTTGREDHDMVKLTVSDSGKGISQEYVQSRLWTPFAQENQNAQGTGLGLAITKRIVNALGGDIGLQTEVGVGTTFTVRLPLRKFVNDPGLSPGSSGVANLLPTDKLYEYTARQLCGSTVAILLPPYDSMDNLSSTGARYADEALMEYLREWFGFRIVTTPTSEADLIIVDEAVLENPSDADKELLESTTPRIILGTREIGTLRNLGQHFRANSPTIYISKPVAPRKLKLAISRVLELPRSTTEERRSSVAIGSLPSSHAYGADGHIEHPKLQLRTRSAEVVTVLQHARGDRAGYTEETLLQLSTLIIDSDTPRSPALAPVNPVPNPRERVPQHSQLRTSQSSPTSTKPSSQSSSDSGSSVSSKPTEGDAGAATGIGVMSAPRTIPRVLVVDDNNINLRLLTMYLRKHGVPSTHIVAAISGLEAVTDFTAVYGSESAFDIVLMDLSMPVMDGFEATKAIRTLEEDKIKRYTENNNGVQENITNGVGLDRPPTPCESNGMASELARTMIVALTGLVSPKDQQKAFEAGVDCYRTKPFSGNDVKALLDSWRTS